MVACAFRYFCSSHVDLYNKVIPEHLSTRSGLRRKNEMPRINCCEGMEDANRYGLIHYAEHKPPICGYFVGRFTYHKKKGLPDYREPYIYLEYCPFCGKKLKEE